MALSPKTIMALVGGGAVAAAAATAVLLSTPPQPAAPNKPPAATTSNPSAPANATGCRQGTALDASQIAGDWTDSSSNAHVKIVAKDPNNPTSFSLQGSHSWDGTYAGGKLVFTRKPLAAEMDHAAPEWARKAVEGQLEWSLELDPQLVNGAKHLCGPWYPGLVKIASSTGTQNGGATQSNGSASIAGKGTPTTVDYTAKPPAIYRVIALDNQTGRPRGVPYQPYPFPLPPLNVKPVSVPEEYTAFFHAANPYLQETERDNPSHYKQYQRAANGRLYIANEKRMLYVVGQGLPRDFKTKLEVEPGMGAAGLEYSVVALSSETPAAMGPQYAALFARGKALALLDVDDSDTRAMIEKGDAMLVSVAMDSKTVPGFKDFKVNNIGGNSQWPLRFGDDNALISFGRDTAHGELELTDNLYLPERVFIEVHTEVAMPVDKVPLRVKLNDKLVTWNGSNTLVAQHVPDDPTGTIYRTATIELVEQGNPQGSADPGIVFLAAKAQDHLDISLDDEGLFAAEIRPAIVQRTPAALGLTWKEALQRAAKLANVNVPDWNQLPGQKASEVSNIIWTRVLLSVTAPGVAAKVAPGLFAKATDALRRWLGANPLTGPVSQSVPITVGDEAALMLFRDEFLRRMKLSVANDALPQIHDNADLRGLRYALQPQAWDTTSAWSYLEVTCPGVLGSSCAYSFALDDDYLKKTFGDNVVAADNWSLKATAEALQKYQDAANYTIQKLQALKDNDAAGMIELLGADCVPEVLDYPCGYKALRPMILPRLMRLTDLDQPQRHLWEADLNARFTLRNLNSLISAVKAQQNFASADRQMAIMIVSNLTTPFLSELGAVGEIAAAVLNNGGMTMVSLASEIPEYIKIRHELKFAQGATLVLGQERLGAAMTAESQFFNELLNTAGSSLVTDAVAIPTTVGGIRAAALEGEIKQLRMEMLKSLPREDQLAIVNAVVSAKILQETHNDTVMGQFERDMAAAGDQLVTTRAPPEATIAATGDVVPQFAPAPGELPTTPFAELAVTQPELGAQATAKTGNMAEIEEAGLNKTAPAAENQAGPAREQTAEAAPANAKAKPASGGGETVAAAGALIPKTGATLELPFNGGTRKFTLGRELGQGYDATVFELVNPGIPGCEKGCVIKFYVTHPETAADVVNSIKTATEELLPAAGVAQLPNHAYVNAGERPYIIQDLLTPDLKVFDPENAAHMAAFAADPALGESVAVLFRKLADAGLIWEDGHLGNLFFKRDGEKWVAGILDQDRIIRFAERKPDRLGFLFADNEIGFLPALNGSLANTRRGMNMKALDDLSTKLFGKPFNTLRPGMQRLQVMQERWAMANFGKPFSALESEQQVAVDLEKLLGGQMGPYSPDAEFYMEKMFEYKNYITFDNGTGTFKKWLIDPSTIKKYFPKLELPDNLAPANLNQPFRKTSQAEPPGKVMNFADARRVRRGIVEGGWREAA